jgi:hypothetical protein
MAHDAVLLPDEILLREIGDLEECLIDVGNPTGCIGLTHDNVFLSQLALYPGWLHFASFHVVAPLKTQ